MKNIDKLVDRFLTWRLPESVASDLCVVTPSKKSRCGTNLLTAIEAKQMLEHIFENEVEENNPSGFAIEYALETEDGLEFLRLWNEGEFDLIRAEWTDCPEECFIGAEVGYVKKSK